MSREGTTVFVTTHYLEEAEYCNNIILINAGKIIAEGSSEELKKNYINNPIFEIECDNVVDAMNLLAVQSFADDTSIFGNSLHLLVNESFINQDQISSVLLENKIKINKISKIIPSLDDVFIHLIEKERK